MPGTGHAYLGRIGKGAILMVLGIIGMFVFLTPLFCEELTWSLGEYLVVAAVWAAAWLFGVLDCAKILKDGNSSDTD